jgi:hypothetical protein
MAFYVARVYFHVLKYIILQYMLKLHLRWLKLRENVNATKKRSNAVIRVTFENSFDSKQPKLVVALSKTKRLFRLFRFYTETESFGVSIEPKQTEVNRNSFIESIFLYFFQKARVVSFCFGLFRNSLFRLFRFHTEKESFDVSIEPKQTEDQPKQFDREHILVFFRKFRVVSVCF